MVLNQSLAMQMACRADVGCSLYLGFVPSACMPPVWLDPTPLSPKCHVAAACCPFMTLQLPCRRGCRTCQVPMLSLPRLMGMFKLVPNMQLFAWAGMSSSPSSVCIQGALGPYKMNDDETLHDGLSIPHSRALRIRVTSGTVLFRKVSMSFLTSGSAFCRNSGVMTCQGRGALE